MIMLRLNSRHPCSGGDRDAQRLSRCFVSNRVQGKISVFFCRNFQLKWVPLTTTEWRVLSQISCEVVLVIEIRCLVPLSSLWSRMSKFSVIPFFFFFFGNIGQEETKKQRKNERNWLQHDYIWTCRLLTAHVLTVSQHTIHSVMSYDLTLIMVNIVL